MFASTVDGQRAIKPIHRDDHLTACSKGHYKTNRLEKFKLSKQCRA